MKSSSSDMKTAQNYQIRMTKQLHDLKYLKNMS